MGRFHEPEYKKTPIKRRQIPALRLLKKISFFNQRKIRGRVYFFKLVSTFLSGSMPILVNVLGLLNRRVQRGYLHNNYIVLGILTAYITG